MSWLVMNHVMTLILIYEYNFDPNNMKLEMFSLRCDEIVHVTRTCTVYMYIYALTPVYRPKVYIQNSVHIEHRFVWYFLKSIFYQECVPHKVMRTAQGHAGWRTKQPDIQLPLITWLSTRSYKTQCNLSYVQLYMYIFYACHPNWVASL